MDYQPDKNEVVSFTGTRDGMTPEQIEVFGILLYELKPFWFVHGDCVGADAEAHAVAMSLGVDVIKRPANLKHSRAFCKGGRVVAPPEPPLNRNKKIVNDGGHLVACPSGYEEKLRSGTWSTVRYARKIGKPLTIIWPDGTLDGEA